MNNNNKTPEMKKTTNRLKIQNIDNKSLFEDKNFLPKKKKRKMRKFNVKLICQT